MTKPEIRRTKIGTAFNAEDAEACPERRRRERPPFEPPAGTVMFPAPQGSTYECPHMWITSFWRGFSGAFLGDFLLVAGPGAWREHFSPKPRMARWASADLHFFAVFLRELIGFCGLLTGAFALLSSRPCPPLFSWRFFRAVGMPLAKPSTQRSQSTQRKAETGER